MDNTKKNPECPDCGSELHSTDRVHRNGLEVYADLWECFTCQFFESKKTFRG